MTGVYNPPADRKTNMSASVDYLHERSEAKCSSYFQTALHNCFLKLLLSRTAFQNSELPFRTAVLCITTPFVRFALLGKPPSNRPHFESFVWANTFFKSKTISSKHLLLLLLRLLLLILLLLLLLLMLLPIQFITSN